MVNFQLEGMEDCLEGINRQLAKINQAVREEVIDACLHLRGQAVERAPIKDGFLRGSGIEEFKETSGVFYGEVSFNQPYALEQHENLFFNHPKGGEAKYLEKPLLENQEAYIRNIRQATERVI